MSDPGEQLYIVPAVAKPTRDEIRRLTEKLNLKSTDDDIEAYTEHCGYAMESYNRVDKLEDYDIEVKYPRTPGTRPKPEENEFNQWYWRCDIKGAPSGELAGKKVGIKDNVCVAGVPMMNGSKILEGYTPDIDATIVTRILDAGGRIVGKTTCENMCLGPCSFTNAVGQVLNPYDMSRSAGGSSGGSAVAVQTGDVDVAIGGDQGGSIRIPSSFCGIVGLKPTFGLVPYTGIYPIDISIDHAGPMARTVTDCALLLEVIAGYDGGLDPRQSCDVTIPEYSKQLDVDVSGKKVALLEEGFTLTKEEPSSCVRDAAYKLQTCGITVDSVSIPLHKDGLDIWSTVATAGLNECMVRGNAAGYGWRGYRCLSMQEAATRGAALRPQDFSVTTKILMLTAEYVKEKYQNKFHSKGHNLALRLKKAYDEVLAQYDVIILPTMIDLPTPLPDARATASELLGMVKPHLVNTAPFNIAGHPALTINAGFVDGLPVGMMIVGKYYDELTVLQIARAFEKLKRE